MGAIAAKKLIEKDFITLVAMRPHPINGHKKFPL
jgi:hypothetical protein